MRVLHTLFEGVAFKVTDFLQFLADSIHDGVEIIAIEVVLPLLAQPLGHLANTLDILTITHIEAAHHHATQRAVDVSVSGEVVGDSLHQVFRLSAERLL